MDIIILLSFVGLSDVFYITLKPNVIIFWVEAEEVRMADDAIAN